MESGLNALKQGEKMGFRVAAGDEHRVRRRVQVVRSRVAGSGYGEAYDKGKA